MGVFLRWGVFGILAVAGLMYAYNASKQMAQRRAADPPPAAQVTQPVAPEAPAAEPVSEPATPAESEADPISAVCKAELDIARRALDFRSVGEPLDRLLRIQEIAWQEDVKRRERLTQVATRWYSQTGAYDAGRLRREVVADCETPRS
jgi:hypothetical protein